MVSQHAEEAAHLLLGMTETGALILQVLLQLRHLALKLLIALLGGSFCFTCHSEPAVISMLLHGMNSW